MTCGSLTDVILDMSRGIAVPEASRRGALRHIEGCAACAAAYARQRELTDALQAVAADAQEWKAPAAVEERLLAAFAERQAEVAPVTVATGRWKYALPVAAAIALAVWGGVRSVDQEKAPAEDFRLKAEASGATAEPASVGANAPQQPREICCQPGLKTRPPRQVVRKPVVAPAAVEFVRIPSAIGLPDIESGTVVRMELPVTALPEYGLDIAPDAARTTIEADVLVGQDGQPRAIRLVGTPEPMAQDSRSRQ
jgi:hypothetical protein